MNRPIKGSQPRRMTVRGESIRLPVTPHAVRVGWLNSASNKLGLPTSQKMTASHAYSKMDGPKFYRQ